MPFKFTVAEDYLHDLVENKDVPREFDPRRSDETTFREFITCMFLDMKDNKKDLIAKIEQQNEKITTLNERLNTIEADNNAAHLLRDKEMNDLRTENNKLRKELGQLSTTVSNNTKNIQSNSDHGLDLERHSRGFNLRFPGIPEEPLAERKKEDCITKVAQKLSQVGLGHIQIENAHRTGKDYTDPSKPRAIIARFISRPERRQVLSKKKEMFEKGIKVFEDLVKADRDRKSKYADVIKQQFEAGKKVWFTRGFYYVDGVKQTAMI